MKIQKKLFLASNLALALFPAVTQAESWQARSLEEIKADISARDNQQTYTVKYGDTLGRIAEALNIDVQLLASLNQISDLNLIFPDTVLTVTSDNKAEVKSIEIATPEKEGETTSTATLDLEKGEVRMEDQTISMADLPLVADDVSKEVVTSPQESQAAETPAEPVESPAPVAETPSVSQENPEPAAPAETNNQSDLTKPEEAAQVVAGQESPEEVVSTEAADQPAASSPATTAPAESQPAQSTYQAPAATDYAGLATTKAENAGLQPQTAAFKEEVASIYGITSFSLYRPGDSGDHGKGLAVDFIVGSDSALGDQVANYAISNMAAKGISYVIWKQQFYSPYPSIYGPANTWNPMPDRGSVTENHYDHVHVSMNS